MTVTWERDVGAGDWIAATLHPPATDVGGVLPPVFAAYARVFHPLVDGPERRWSDLAARNGRVVHAGMQHHRIASPPGRAPTEYVPLSDMDVGSLPKEQVLALRDVLRPFTSETSRCRFAVWDGFGQLHGGSAHRRLTSEGGVDLSGLVPAEVLAGPRLELPGRHYLLLTGHLDDVGDLHEMLGGQSPNLWWPDDRSWFVATEIDFGWTYVGGSTELIDALVCHPSLEALPTVPTEGVTYDSDHLNAALDEV